MADPNYWMHDPDARLDYAWDWAAWLDGDTIASATIDADGMTADPPTITGGRVTVWLSGGTLGTHKVACRITTQLGRVDERTRTIYITER